MQEQFIWSLKGIPDNQESLKSFTFIFQGICLNFESNFTIFEEFMDDILNDVREHLTVAAPANMFYIAIN